jgi:hypothetical protein
MRISPKRIRALRVRSLTSIVAVSLLLTMSLPYSKNSRASVETKPTTTNRPSWQTIQDRTIEQRDRSNEVTARLQVSSEGPGEARFSVEDIRSGIHSKLAAMGNVSLRKGGFTVEVQDAKSNGRLAMKLHTDGPDAESARIVLRFNGVTCRLVLDVGEAVRLGREVRNLDAATRQMRLAQLSSHAASTISSPDDYLSFVRQVEASPMFDSLGLISSLLTSSDGVKNNNALLTVSYAVKIFAPSAHKDQYSRAIGAKRGSVLTAGGLRKCSVRSAAPHGMADCAFCADTWVAWTEACFDLYALCPIPPDACFATVVACLAAADLFLYNCARDCT